jgi:hypothetical protein
MSVYGGPEIVNSGLVLCLDAANPKSYPGSGTTWTDMSGLGNHGTLTNGPTFSSNNAGGIVFDGTNDYVSLLPSTRYTTLTIEIWFKTTTVLASRQYLYTQQTNPPTLAGFTYQQRQGCQIETNTIIFQYMNELNNSFFVTATPTIQSNIWYQFVATLNGSSYQLYLNGSSVGMIPNASDNAYVSTNTNSKIFTPNQAYIGLRGDAQGDDRFSGTISTLREYNRALSAAEISQNFNALRGRYGI